MYNERDGIYKLHITKKPVSIYRTTLRCYGNNGICGIYHTSVIRLVNSLYSDNLYFNKYSLDTKKLSL